MNDVSDRPQACERQEACWKATKEIAKDLETFFSIKNHARELNERERTQAAVIRLLDLISQISDYIIENTTNRIYGPCTGQLLLIHSDYGSVGNMFSTKLKDKIDDFRADFARAKELLDRSVNLDILGSVQKQGKRHK